MRSSTVGVVGGGRMGAGIAHAFMVAGADVVLIEQHEDAVRAAQQRIEDNVSRSAERGVEVNGSLTLGTELRALAGCGIVVEAVPEDFSLKQETLAAIEAHAPGALIGTNTSSFSVDRLAGALQAPEALLGLHFFNPVPASKLVEVVVGSRTLPALAGDAVDLVRRLGKTPIVVRDSPGFASSRLGVALALEAMRMLESGVASAEDIDLTMTLGYRHPVGPLRTTDIVGLDVRLAIAEYLEIELGSRFSPPEILREKVAQGELGQKVGRGFYEW